MRPLGDSRQRIDDPEPWNPGEVSGVPGVELIHARRSEGEGEEGVEEPRTSDPVSGRVPERRFEHAGLCA